jgi:hypothetical protein
VVPPVPVVPALPGVLLPALPGVLLGVLLPPQAWKISIGATSATAPRVVTD